jgi:very-short-patch-repair endonuclease
MASAEVACVTCGVTLTRKASQLIRKDGSPLVDTYCSRKCLTRRVDRVCETCGQTYNAKRTMNRRWCSRSCRYATPKMRVSQACLHCGQTVSVNLFRAKKGQGIYCSIGCRAKAKELPPFTLVCMWCQRDYELPGDHGYWRGKRKFCSPECRVSGIGKVSALEKATGSILAGLGVTHEPQHRIGRLVADFYIPDRNLLIEVKGCYWHACAECDLPGIKPQRRMIDQHREDRLRSMGYGVLILWQHEVRAGKAERIIREAVGVL